MRPDDPTSGAWRKGGLVRIVAAVLICLFGGLLVVPAGAARADPDPTADVQELQRQISDLHDNWDGLAPEQRNSRIAELQRQVTTVDHEIHALPADQQPGV